MLTLVLGSASLAIHASMKNYRDNEKVATTTQASRSILDRITRDIRVATAVSTTDYRDLKLIPPPNAEGVQEVDEIRYEFTGNALVYHQTISGNTQTYNLLGGDDDRIKVYAFYVNLQTATRTEGEGASQQVVTYTTRVDIWLDVEVEGELMTLRASAAPRKNQNY